MNLTDNEIIKAFETCYKGYDELLDKVRDVLNRQKAEIEKLNIAFAICKKEYDDMFEIAQKQMAEIERLKNAYKQCAWERDIFAEDMGEYDPYTDSFVKKRRIDNK